MKIFTNKKLLFKLIVALCIFLALISFAYPKEVHAGWGFDLAKGAAEKGGTLLSPFIDLVLALADGVVDILQQAIMGTESSISINTALSMILGLLAAIAMVVAVVAASIVLPGIIPIIGPILAKISAGAVAIIALTAGSWAYSGVQGKMLPDITLLPTYSISPEEIFRGDILLFDVNIFNPKELYVKVKKDDSETTMTAKEWNATDSNGNHTNSYRNSGYEVEHYYYHKDGNVNNNDKDNVVATSANNSAFELRNVVSKWYYAIRNIALIGLMIVLAYVGIRMMISSTASEKSKYKQMLGDWVIAMCLVFVMQFIMVFANNVTESFTLLLSSVSDDNYHIVEIEDADKKLIEGVEEAGLGEMISEDKKDIYWETNLMGKARIMAQEENGTTGYIGYALCYLVLVIYTVIFTVTYAKRLLYIIFFTIISPLVALTYPIDKINDGKAQAFNVWIREYIFNLLIQPFHLLLYTVLISSAFDLAGTNIVYTLVAIGFMIPAEKFLRKMFGFDKASTPGFLDGAAGAALTMHGLHSLQKIAGRGPGSKTKQGNDSKDAGKIDFMDRGASSGYKTDNLLTEIGNKPKPPTQETKQTKTNQPVAEKESDSTKKPTSTKMPTDTDSSDVSETSESEMSEDSSKVSTVEIPTDSQEPPQELSRLQDFDEISPDDEPTSTLPKSNKIPKYTLKQYAAAGFRNYKRRISDGIAYAKTFEGQKDFAMRVAKTGIGAAGKTAGLVTGGMLGAASDIASGSFGKNTAGGILAGEAIGTGLSNLASNTIDGTNTRAERMHEETLKEIYGDQYSEYIRQKKDDMFLEDKNTRELFEREFSGDLSNIKGKNNAETKKLRKQELNKIMNAAVEYRRYGVKDNGTIIKAMKMNRGNETNWTDPERIAAARFSQSVKSEKDLDSIIKRYTSTPGITTEQGEAMRERIRKINDSKM